MCKPRCCHLAYTYVIPLCSNSSAFPRYNALLVTSLSLSVIGITSKTKGQVASPDFRANLAAAEARLSPVLPKPRVLRKEIREQRAAFKTLGVADRKEAAKLVKGYSAFRPPRCIVGHATFAVRRPPR